VLRLGGGSPLLPPLLGPELTGRLIQDREGSPPQLFPLPLLEQSQSALVGFGSSRQHQVREARLAPECGAAALSPVERRKGVSIDRGAHGPRQGAPKF